MKNNNCVYVLKNLKNEKLCIGSTDDFDGEFEKNQKSILVSAKFFENKKEADKLEKYLKSEKGLAELKKKIARKNLGILG